MEPEAVLLTISGLNLALGGWNGLCLSRFKKIEKHCKAAEDLCRDKEAKIHEHALQAARAAGEARAYASLSGASGRLCAACVAEATAQLMNPASQVHVAGTLLDRPGRHLVQDLMERALSGEAIEINMRPVNRAVVDGPHGAMCAEHVYANPQNGAWVR